MKLIIDIPKEVKEKFNKTDNINFCFYDYNSFIGKAIRNGTPLSEEFENIKEKIQGLIDFEESCCGNTTLGYQCLGVIEDRIAEMKGENK